MFVGQFSFGDLSAHEPRFESIKAEHVRAVVDAVGEVIAERVEFFVGPIFAVDNQRLMRRHGERFAEILEHGRHLRLETRAEKFVFDVFVFVVFAGDDVERALAVAGIQPLDLRNLHVFEERAALRQLAAEERAVGGLRVDGFPAPRSAAEANQDNVWSAKVGFRRGGVAHQGLSGGQRAARGQHAGAGQDAFEESAARQSRHAVEWITNGVFHNKYFVGLRQHMQLKREPSAVPDNTRQETGKLQKSRGLKQSLDAK